MSSIAAAFDELGRARRTALMPYLTMGYPQRDSALELVPALEAAGADLVELGVPFSDPLADGTTIQVAGDQALAQGMTLALCLEQAATLRASGVALPFVLMGYYNPIFQMGLESFAQSAAEAGIDGVIIPDLPPEESDALGLALGSRQIDLVFLIPPTAGEERARCVSERTSGFVYLVSLTGVTGARDRLPPELESFVASVRQVTDLPLAVGFGIGTPDQAARVASIADGVIVGSALVRTIGEAEDPVGAAYAFVSSLRIAMDASGR
jgi:tryptophan synthase alpha chain